MRGYGWGVVLLAAAGCSPGQVSFEHQSQLETRTRGVALLDTDDVAQVGMGGNTCEVQPSSGMIGADYDVVELEDDQVQDAFGSDTVVVGTDGVWVVDQGFWGTDSTPDVDAGDVLEARLADDAVVTLQGSGESCTVGWYNSSMGDASVSVSGLCDGAGFAIDRDSGMAFVGSLNGVAIATPDGVSTVEASGDLIAYDVNANALYVATAGGTEVQALELDGTVRWAVELAAPIASLDDMGELRAVAVMTGDSRSGELVVLDGMTGEAVSTLATPSAADDIVVGNNGRTMAVVLPSEVHFFNVDLSTE